MVLEYSKEKCVELLDNEIAELTDRLEYVKKTTEMYPAGIIVIPDVNTEEEIPLQYPENNCDAEYMCTHFDYCWIFDYLYKLDLLEHDDPSMLHQLEILTGVKSNSIPLGDKKTMELFSSGITYGVPEFRSQFVAAMMKETGVTSFDDLIRICGLSHGTDAWLYNGKYYLNECGKNFRN